MGGWAGGLFSGLLPQRLAGGMVSEKIVRGGSGSTSLWPWLAAVFIAAAAAYFTKKR